MFLKIKYILKVAIQKYIQIKVKNILMSQQRITTGYRKYRDISSVILIVHNLSHSFVKLMMNF